jgi:biopolymer transport protein ExbD
MKIKRRRQTVPENTALSDLAFLLIIYFIVIAGFNINRGFLLGLPEKDSVRMVLREDLLRFRLDGEGRIFLGDRVIGFSEADAELQAAVRAKPDLTVVLTVSPQAPWQRVVSFVDLAWKSSVESFSFSMDQGEI